MSKLTLLLSIISISLFANLSALAAPTERGFQIPLSSLTAESIDDLVNNWKVNIIRVQVGNNNSMDGTTGAAYDSMMEEQFTLLDQKLPLLEARGLKMIFCLYSPPGGFESRQAPSQYLMFSQPELQNDFIKIWQTIANRYGASSIISAFDLVNEPAQRKGALASGARPWHRLATDTISAIRAILPTKPIIVRSVYGDPGKLSLLTVLNDPNISYSYNSYIWPKYQTQGFSGAPFSVNRPSDAAILAGIRKRLAPFFLKTWQRVDKGELPSSAYPPKLVVGEAAVSACAPNSGDFMNGLLSALESDNSLDGIAARNKELRQWRRKRRTNRRLKKPVFNAEDFLLDVKHTSYGIHSFAEEGAPGWDPRYVCAADGSLSLSPSDTDRGVVLKTFFGRN